jgi:zinc protease
MAKVWLAATIFGALIAASCTSVAPEDLPHALPVDGVSPDDSTVDDAAAAVDDETATDEPGSGRTDDDTPLGLDDAVETGTLANGLTYYLRRNASPGESVTVRLAVDAGSRQQVRADDGVAHFLEHMLFNGTERWPGNELDRVLQTLGAGIGPDINAYTSFDETVYELSVSTFDDDAVETAFAVLAEWAARATIEPDEVLAERGVVRDEYRQRVENGSAAVANALLELYLDGTPYEDRSPIGSVEAIESTEAPELRAFYERWYHPENMAVIVVGDLSTDAMLELLEDSFADIEGRGEAPPRAEPLAIDPQPESTAAVVTNPEEVVDNLSVDWRRPPSDPATIGGARLDLLDDLIMSMLTSRLDDAYLAGAFAVDRTPFISRFEVARHLQFFGTNLRGDDLGLAYTQLLGYLQAAALDGFSPSELAEAIAEREAGLAAWEESIPTTQDFAWSEGYVAHFLRGVGGEAPATTIERERSIMAALTLDEVDQRWAFIHERSGPIAVALGDDAATLPTADDLDASVAAAEPIAPVAAEEAITSLMAPPEPVEPVTVERRDGVFATTVTRRYANGATVIIEPSPIVEGTISLLAEAQGGSSTLPIDQHDLAFLAANVVGRSGFETATTGQVNDFLADRNVALETWISDYAEGFEGTSGSEDFELLLQLVHLGVTQPTVDPTVLASTLVDARGLVERVGTDPGLQADVALSQLVLGDARYDGVVDDIQLDVVTADLLLDLYDQRLGSVDDLIVAITGDLDIATAIDLSDRYIGTLPAGPSDTYRDITAPLVTAVERVDITLPDGSGDAGMQLRWETPDLVATDRATSAVLQQIISSLIFDTAREELGASYGGGASVVPTTVPHDGVLGFVAIDGDPARLDEIQQRLFADLARLAEDGPTGDEFDRAVAVLSDDLQFVNNLEIMLENIETERNGEPPALSIATRAVEILRVSAADVADLAARLFDLDVYIEVRRS